MSSRVLSPSSAGPDCPDVASPSTELTFDGVYAEYGEFVWRALARLGVAEAQLADATQEVFIVVHRRLAQFEGRSALRTWLFGIVLRVASQAARQARRRPSEPLPETLADDPGRTPFEDAARSEATRLLYRILDELTPDQRAVFVLVELSQMSIPEAAEALEANVHTVTSRLKVARQRFEAALRRLDPARYRRQP